MKPFTKYMALAFLALFRFSYVQKLLKSAVFRPNFDHTRLMFSIFGLSIMLISCEQKSAPVQQEAPAKAEITEFLGNWSLDIKDGGVGWLSVSQEDGYIDASLLWKGGSVVPVANVYLDGSQLIVTRTGNVVKAKDENGEPLRSHTVTTTLEIQKDGPDKLTGTFSVPNKDGIGISSTQFTGVLLPDPGPKPDLSSLKFGEPIQLFNGKDLTGWRLINENQKNGFSAKDGVLVNNPVQPENGEHIHYGNLRTEREFEDFNLTLEVNVPEGSNSGVYLRGIYEIQVFDSYGKELDPHNMGALYSRITPSTNAEKPAGTWQKLDITLADRFITVKLNGTTIIDNQPALGPTGGAMSADVFAPGPIYLQGDHGTVSYRNIVLTPIVK